VDRDSSRVHACIRVLLYILRTYESIMMERYLSIMSSPGANFPCRGTFQQSCRLKSIMMMMMRAIQLYVVPDQCDVLLYICMTSTYTARPGPGDDYNFKSIHVLIILGHQRSCSLKSKANSYSRLLIIRFSYPLI